MNFWTWFSLAYVFIAITISQLFIEDKLRLIFLMIMFLLYVSIYNVYFSFKYYIKIRNEPGIKGDRGDPGVPGQGGTDGICGMSKGCGIASCRKLIVDELKMVFPEYVIIRKKLSKNQELSAREKKQNRQFNSYIDLLIPKCENFDGDTNAFKVIISQTIKKSSK